MFGKLVERLLAETVCDAASSILRSCGDFADSSKLRRGTRRHNPACPSQHIAISLEEDDVTIVIGFFAEEDPDGYVRVFSPEYILPEVEEFAD